MSSILRALKKVEAEAAGREGPGREQKINKTGAVRRDAGANRSMYRNLFFAAVVLLVGAAVWIFFNAFEKPPSKKSLDAAPKKQAASVTHSPPPPAAKKEIKWEVEEKAAPLPGTETGQEKPALSPAPVSPKNILPDSVRAVVKNKPFSRSQFLLKGIIWSDNPARRVALINDRYLKEGDKINGVELVRISRDEVILKSGKKEWAVKVQK